MKIRSIYIGALLIISAACTRSNVDSIHPDLSQAPNIPEGFDPMPYPEDNAYDSARWALGKALFYDQRLSKDNKVSCASCHRPEYAFADRLPTSPGVNQQPGTRNVPSLGNIGYHPYFTREGGVPTLEMHVLVPVQEENEFGHNIVAIAEELKTDAAYAELSRMGFGDSLTPYVITRSLGTFQRTMISGNSPYDQYVHRGDKKAISASARRGMELFFSDRLNCGSCHSGFNFTNYAFTNNGLYEQYSDPGRHRLTGEQSDLATFKVPSLRNVAVTAPYMHDGSIAGLEGVIDHYENGVESHPNLGEEIASFTLTKKERKDLISFLESLTDPSFIESEQLRPVDVKFAGDE